MTGLFDIQVEYESDKMLEAFPSLIEEMLEQIGFFLRDELVGEAPRDMGYLGGSFEVNITNPGEVTVSSPLNYALFVQTGTQPHFPPWEPIAEYAHRIGAEPFPIWYGIGVHGTQANPYVDRAMQTTEKNAEGVMEAVLRTQGLL